MMKTRYVLLLSLLLLTGASSVQAGQAGCRIALVLSETSYYISSMESGFKEGMVHQGLIEEKNVSYLRVVLPRIENEKIDKEILRKLNETKIDLIVSFGTDAGLFMARSMNDGQIPLLFAGMTDPVGAGLLESMEAPPKNHVTGISYTIPPQMLFKFIHELLPSVSEVVFLCFPYPADMAYRSFLEKSISKQFVVHYAELSDQLVIPSKYLKQGRAVLGWYGLYRHQKELSEKYPGTRFIGTNISQLEKGALATLSPNDTAMGAETAKMAADIILRRRNINEIRPQIPFRYMIGINLPKAGQLNLAIPETMISVADRVIR
ncbi:MAG: hypothetical protein HQK57_04065 [Deltaproteobacteria bacterium]|nr:hypothetical protein [Deltaproteobacteria bacterium]MBF0508086.1 hypothetical protein [Deltaproteobacteria bacterium]MBF0524119.1 hypothetical protein [Deltaproteobacteria bacterium]